MNVKFVRWLHAELPLLVKQGVLSQAAADRLKEHYGVPEKGGRAVLAITLLSITGSLLIGAGIMILIAHNWDGMSHFSRAMLGLSPLAAAQCLGGYALYKKKASRKWTESTAVLILMLSGSSIAIVGQTYNLGGTTWQFLVTWMALSVPLAYIFRSTLASLLCLAGTCGYFIVVTRGYEIIGDRWPYIVYFALLFAAGIPYFIMKLRENRYSVDAVLLSIGYMALITVALEGLLGYDFLNADNSTWVFAFAMLFTLFYLAGKLIAPEAPTMWQRPMQTAGGFAVMSISYLLALNEPFHIRWDGSLEYASVAAFVVFCAIAAGLALLIYRARSEFPSPIALMPVLFAAGYFLNRGIKSDMGMIVLFNIFVFAAGVAVFLMGARSMNMQRINAGMFLVALMIVSHFFTTEIGFLAKGLVFVFLGSAFVATNIILIRKKRAS